ncbi:MAG: hypothetical protein FIA99_04710 [Ruminiclostridium sp.]|nr:hypothetical protein [Ruminiclostridium sp.]
MNRLKKMVEKSTNIYYVDRHGDDNNPGTLVSPWLTIQKAADSVAAGDTVYVRAGTYSEKLSITRSGSAGNIITYSAYPDETVVIDGNNVPPVDDWQGLVNISGSYIAFLNFRVINSRWAGIFVENADNVIIQGNYIAETKSAGILCRQGTNYKILYNELYHTSGYYVQAKGDSSDSQESISIQNEIDGFEVAYNYLHDVGMGGRQGCEGIDTKAGVRNGSAHHNRIINARSVGIYVDAWDTYADNIDVYDNFISDSPSSGISVSAEDGGTVNGVRIYNNIVTGVNWGMMLPAYDGSSGGTLKNVSVVNNTIYNNNSGPDKFGIWIGAWQPTYIDGLYVRNNIISRNINNQIRYTNPERHSNIVVEHNLIDGSSDLWGTDYVMGDPHFVNPSGGDFHIGSSSPARGRGTSTGFVPVDDYDVNIRPQGAAYDIGAFEYIYKEDKA